MYLSWNLIWISKIMTILSDYMTLDSIHSIFSGEMAHSSGKLSANSMLDNLDNENQLIQGTTAYSTGAVQQVRYGIAI